MMLATKSKQKRDQYEMHKYWGKKPSNNLSDLIDKFTKPGDIVLDPFSGYGVFCCEAYLKNRNVISNDLNPVSCFIQQQLFNTSVDFEKLDTEYNKIVADVSQSIRDWFYVKTIDAAAINVLRDKNNQILKCRFKNGKKTEEYTFTELERKKFSETERSWKSNAWHPSETLIPNSRISAKKGMTVADLFTRRALECHAILLESIQKNSSGSERDLLTLAFTSNLANCSKLVPPIKSRGDMSQGAWMTGFYWGETYLENNVLHYFQNRYKKVVKGKIEYLSRLQESSKSTQFPNRYKAQAPTALDRESFGYVLLENDAKEIGIKDDSIDYVFTDPPYGDTVPYFEQSAIWNSWISREVKYENEIVISDSPCRKKGITDFADGIKRAIHEIFRVLKPEKYFTVTFHSLSGSVWNCLINACASAGFEFHEYEWLTQKTFTPRQLNKAKSIKGDILITFKKPASPIKHKTLNKEETEEFYIKTISTAISEGSCDTNDIFVRVVRSVFSNHAQLFDINFFKLLGSNYNFDENTNKWYK